MVETIIFLAMLTAFCWLTVWEMRRTRRFEFGWWYAKGAFAESDRPKLFRSIMLISAGVPLTVAVMLATAYLKEVI